MLDKNPNICHEIYYGIGVGLLLIVLCALAGFFASAGLWRDAIFASDAGFFIDTILIACSHHIIMLMICTSVCFIVKNTVFSEVAAFSHRIMEGIVNPIPCRSYDTDKVNILTYYALGNKPEMYTVHSMPGQRFCRYLCGAVCMGVYLIQMH